MKKKEYFFQKFLQDCLRNEDLRSSFILQEFLSLSDEKAFAKLLKEREKDKAPEFLSQFYTTKGELQVNSTLETWRYCQILPEVSDKYKYINTQIINLKNTFVEQSKQLSETLETLAIRYQQLSEMYEELDEEPSRKAHVQMSHIMSSWRDTFENQHSMVGEKFSDFYDYQLSKQESLVELGLMREKIKDKFIGMDQNLRKRKTKLLSMGDHSRYKLKPEDLNRIAEIGKDPELAFEVMLPEESEKVRETRNTLNNFSNLCESQVKQMFKHSLEDMKLQFSISE